MNVANATPSERTQQTPNETAFRNMTGAEPVLLDVAPAIDVIPGYQRNVILTSGPPLPWDQYYGGQRDAVIGAALYEGLARNAEEADTLIARGEIRLAPCGEFDCVGSLAGVYSASMPVFVVQNRTHGNFAYCNVYEGSNPRRLNYGVYDDGVRDRLNHIGMAVAPVIGAAVRAAGEIPLKPIMKRALHMGDELHSRNTAASLLFGRELFPYLLELRKERADRVAETVRVLTEDHYFFLRLSMAAAKTMGDAAHGVPGSSLVSAMAFNCRHFGIRVSGLGERWFLGPHPEVHARLFDGKTEADITWMGGESTITETVGIGGFAQAAAFPLQAYQGGSAEAMVDNNVSMYRITHAEHPDFRIPFLAYRGTPTGIDVLKVLETGVTPVMDLGIAGKGGGQIGAGLVRAHIGCFEAAAREFRAQYGEA